MQNVNHIIVAFSDVHIAIAIIIAMRRKCDV